ncbi:MAG: hypothetical protein PHY30_03120 [Candidatus Pacebacteria bacterium]|nr:hypothetical protein [Candidatus Paceibacterota bacterium]
MNIIFDTIYNYLSIFLSWPVAVFSLVLIFFFNFEKEIKFFISNMSQIKWGPFEASQQENKLINKEEEIEKKLRDQGLEIKKGGVSKTIEDLENEKATKDKEIENRDEIIKFLIEKSEIYEFSYLNLFLVENSKLALLNWFKNPTTKDNFIANFVLSGQVANPAGEKEAIFSVLLSNFLIKEEKTLFQISEKGKKFLRYIKLLN